MWDIGGTIEPHQKKLVLRQQGCYQFHLVLERLILNEIDNISADTTPVIFDVVGLHPNI